MTGQCQWTKRTSETSISLWFLSSPACAEYNDLPGFSAHNDRFQSLSEWVDVCYRHTCTHMETAGGSLVFPLSLFLPYCLRQGHLLILKLPSWLSWLGSELPGPVVALQTLRGPARLSHVFLRFKLNLGLHHGFIHIVLYSQPQQNVQAPSLVVSWSL